MTTETNYLEDARAVLDFIAGHPGLSTLAHLAYRSSPSRVGGAHHEVQLHSNHTAIPLALAWHDALIDPVVVLDSYANDTNPSVHIGVTGLLPTGQAIRVFAGVEGVTHDLLRLDADMTLGEKDKRIDVNVLRRVVTAQLAEAVA